MNGYILRTAVITLCLCIIAVPAMAGKTLTIIHTNDIHSHLQSFGPEIDYNPQAKGNDLTKGGMSRIATIIKDTKKERQNDTLVLDGGDFMMGTLFHMISREEATELRIMKEAGYDALALGNHEFDLKPDGLARILKSGSQKGMPPVLCANLEFDPNNKEDDRLQKAYDDGLIKPFIVVERSGLKIGIFGLIGKNAASVAPFAKPVRFADPVRTARDMIKKLRNDEKVDLVICLSHGGLHLNDKGFNEDVLLAREVPGIDVIVSGHTHTLLNKPIVENSTIILQSGAFGSHVGVLDISIDFGLVSLKKYSMIDVNASIASDARIQGMVDQARDIINKQVLADKGLSYNKIIAKTDFPLTLEENDSTLGNIIADSIRWAIDRSEFERTGKKTDFAFESNGLIRDDIVKGKTGNLSVSDCFRAIPLGFGVREDVLGYPLASIYLYGHEIKKTLEILTSVYPMKGRDYYLQVSGLKFRYNPNRIIFDRVVDVHVGDDDKGYTELDMSETNKKLYKVGGNIFNLTFIKTISSYTYKILTIVPKDAQGNPIKDLRDAVVDADPHKPGVHELKQWYGFLSYMSSFKDTDGDGIADVPLLYKYPQSRIVVQKSWNPAFLYKNSTVPTWTLTGVGAFILAGLFIIAL